MSNLPFLSTKLGHASVASVAAMVLFIALSGQLAGAPHAELALALGQAVLA